MRPLVLSLTGWLSFMKLPGSYPWPGPPRRSEGTSRLSHGRYPACAAAALHARDPGRTAETEYLPAMCSPANDSDKQTTHCDVADSGACASSHFLRLLFSRR